jgi:uncharacterized PurR-regulated membrane protein YhhQ (DUF165 family)
MLYVTAYLAAIVAANLTVAHFGKAAIYPNAFIFIGLDLTARDKLHDAWRRRHLFRKMAALIAAGSLLTWLINRDAAQIAAASFIAFAAAASTDALIYHLLRDRAGIVKINGSNLFSAGVDSLLFPTIAFGALDLVTTIGQFTAKLLGGFFWSLFIDEDTRAFIIPR